MTWDEFRDAYNHPKNRGDIRRAHARFDRIVKFRQLEELKGALCGYLEYQRENPWYQPQQCSTFLGAPNSERWRDWAVETVVPEPEPGLLLKEIELQERADAIIRERERSKMKPVPRDEIVSTIRRNKA